MAWRNWRRSRPFWGGLWCIVGGLIIAYAPLTALKLILVAGTSVWAGILMGVLVALMGLVLWFAPSQRIVAAVLAIAFSIVSLVTSNLGGYFLGMILGVVGGALGFGWMPVTSQAPTLRQRPVTSSAMPQEERESMPVGVGSGADWQR
jgi:MFS family permease